MGGPQFSSLREVLKMATAGYRNYNPRKPSNEAVYSFRPGLSRSLSQWEIPESQPSPRYSSSSSWDLARPNTSSSGSSTFSSPPPYHDLATGEYRYLHRMRWKKEKEEWNLANGINFSYTSPYMSDSSSIVKH